MRERSFETRFVIGALATWRLVHLIAHEDGPGDAIVRMRARVGDSPVGSLMDCFDCLSVWIAAPFALATARRRRDVAPTWLALSGAACLLERATRDPYESVEEGPADGLLRPRAASV